MHYLQNIAKSTFTARATATATTTTTTTATFLKNQANRQTKQANGQRGKHCTETLFDHLLLFLCSSGY